MTVLAGLLYTVIFLEVFQQCISTSTAVSGCSYKQHYGYHTANDSQGITYDLNWDKLKYFVSSQDTAFELSMLQHYDGELLIEQLHVSYQQKADIFNYTFGFKPQKKLCHSIQAATTLTFPTAIHRYCLNRKPTEMHSFTCCSKHSLITLIS